VSLSTIHVGVTSATLAARARRMRSSARITLTALALVLAAACSPGPPPAPAGEPASPADAGDAAVASPCAKGLRLEGSVCTASLVGFTRSDVDLGSQRDHHTTHVFVVGGVPYLYVTGGTTGWKGEFSDVVRAKIRGDGGLEAFGEAGSLPLKIAGHSLVRVGDVLVLVGGTTGTSISSATYTTKFGADGRIEGWTQGPNLPVGVMHTHAAVLGEYVYIAGGRGHKTGTSVAEVARMRVLADGTTGPMEALAPLPADRSHGMVFERQGFIYLFGGLRGDPAGKHEPLADVIRAKPTPEGKLVWEPAGALALPRSVTAAELVGDGVYVLGGLEGSATFRNDVLRGRFDGAGKLTFETLPAKLPSARGHVHQTPFFAGSMYSVGGINGAGKTFSSIDVATFE